MWYVFIFLFYQLFEDICRASVYWPDRYINSFLIHDLSRISKKNTKVDTSSLFWYRVKRYSVRLYSHLCCRRGGGSCFIYLICICSLISNRRFSSFSFFRAFSCKSICCTTYSTCISLISVFMLSNWLGIVVWYVLNPWIIVTNFCQPYLTFR